MKKIILLLGTLGLFGLTTVASAQSSDQYFETGGLGYIILSAEDRTVEVTALHSSTFYRGNINIPPSVVYNGETYNVVALGEEAFEGSTLSSVTIPSSVIEIKRGCFFNVMGSLSAINIPASVTSIGEYAFVVQNLTAINVDENNPSYRTIDGMLFSKDTATLMACPAAKSGAITLPQNTKYIANYAFTFCFYITGVTLHEGISSIGCRAFWSNRRLNNIVIPSSVSHIGPNPFAYCLALDNLTLSDGNMHYYLDGMMIYSADGDSLLSAHKSADSVFLPNTLRYVNGFGLNQNVRYVNVPDGVTTIGDETFNGSTLVSIDLPNHLDLMGEGAFAYCNSLTRVAMPSSLDTMRKECFFSCENLTSIDIPNGLRAIPPDAFNSCTSLSHITWGDAVETIGEAAFGDCAFTDLIFPSTLRSIGLAAFPSYNGMADMGRVVFTAPIDTIEPEAFTQRQIGLLQFVNTAPPVTVTMPEYGEDLGCLYYATVDTIVIPCGTLDAYLSDSYWGQFADFYYEDCSGIEEAVSSRQTAVSVYPNPTTSQLHINANGQPITSIDIHSITGQPVVTKTFQHSDSQAIIDLSTLPAGVYYLTVKSGQSTTLHKVVKIE